jgi:hypothetical protein
MSKASMKTRSVKISSRTRELYERRDRSLDDGIGLLVSPEVLHADRQLVCTDRHHGKRKYAPVVGLGRLTSPR